MALEWIFTIPGQSRALKSHFSSTTAKSIKQTIKKMWIGVQRMISVFLINPKKIVAFSSIKMCVSLSPNIERGQPALWRWKHETMRHFVFSSSLSHSALWALLLHAVCARLDFSSSFHRIYYVFWSPQSSIELCMCMYGIRSENNPCVCNLSPRNVALAGGMRRRTLHPLA